MVLARLLAGVLLKLLTGGAVAQTRLPEDGDRGGGVTRPPTALPAGSNWTGWLNRDDAGNSGDFEQYRAFEGQRHIRTLPGRDAP